MLCCKIYLSSASELQSCVRHCVGFQRHKFSAPKIESTSTKKCHAFRSSINAPEQKTTKTMKIKITTRLVVLRNFMRARVMCCLQVCSSDCKSMRSLCYWYIYCEHFGYIGTYCQLYAVCNTYGGRKNLHTPYYKADMQPA